MTTTPPRFHDDLLRAIDDLGFEEPTPIQRQAIPPALAGRDVLATAMTGSGKTAAFLLPILQNLIGKQRGTTRALVITPTRELAAQIVEHFQELARYTKLRAAAVYGGVGMKPQTRAFQQGVDLIVACPGRLLDHFSESYAKLGGLEVLVLDEADRMLDMGFLPDIRRVLRHLPRRGLQTMLFSATMPPPIVELSRDLLRDPVRIAIQKTARPATGVSQAIFPVRQDLKSKLLCALLADGEIHNALVFTRTKHRADRLARFLDRHGIPADRIHGNRSQGQRTKALADFKNGKSRVLVATDIAARGIDVELLSHVINFDVPNVPEDYIHRVGRTARAQATGEAYTFVSPGEQGDLRAIERAIGKSLPRWQLDGFGYEAPRQEELERPLAERIAEIRARKASERARSKAKTERKSPRQADGAGARPRRRGEGGRQAQEPVRGARGGRPGRPAAEQRPQRRRGGRPGGGSRPAQKSR